LIHLDNDFVFDADYLARLRARDKMTEDHFYQHFRLTIRNKLWHKVPAGEVEDLSQSVFTEAFRKIYDGKPDEPGKLPSYVMQVCHNLICKYYDEKSKGLKIAGEDREFADVLASPEARLLREAERQKVNLILGRLIARYREVIDRIFFRDQDRETVAREMGESRENVRLILCRALQRFKLEWDSGQQRRSELYEPSYSPANKSTRTL